MSLSSLEKNKYVNKINLRPNIIKSHNSFILVWDGEFKQIEDIFEDVSIHIAENDIDIFKNIPIFTGYKEVITLYKETEKKPTKKQSPKDDDIIEIADGTLLNKQTNEEFVTEIIEDDDSNFFN